LSRHAVLLLTVQNNGYTFLSKDFEKKKFIYLFIYLYKVNGNILMKGVWEEVGCTAKAFCKDSSAPSDS